MIEIDAGAQVALSIIATCLALAGVTISLIVSRFVGSVFVGFASLVAWSAIDAASLRHFLTNAAEIITFLAPAFMTVAVLACLAAALLLASLCFKKRG